MFENIKNWILRGVEKMLSKNTIEEALKVKTAISDEMDSAIKLWMDIYLNKAPWLNEDIESSTIGVAIAEELSRLTTLEMNTSITGSERAKYINEFYKDVIVNLKIKLILFNSVGGGFFKPYVKDDKIYVDYVDQANCKPISYDNSGNITGVVFISTKTVGDKVYTRLEKHYIEGNNYIVENKAYLKNAFDYNVLGREVPLNKVDEWSNLEPITIISNIEKPLFAYYKVPLANTVDPKSCLGISVYHKAISKIKKADIQEARLEYEYDSGERSIYADVAAVEEKNGITKRAKIIKTLDTGEDHFYKEFSPEIRDESYIRGLNKLKQDIEFTCHVAYGTISEPSAIEKTATEINASKQRTYDTIADMQASLENALKQLVYAMEVYCDLYDLVAPGKCELTIDWDDSIKQDKAQLKVMGMQEVGAGLMSKKRYLMNINGMSEEDAEKELMDIRNQNKTNTLSQYDPNQENDDLNEDE